MMKAEIKYLHSPDIPELETFQPQINDDFGFLLQMFVGEKGKEGEESFDMMVCTPKWLMSNHSQDEILFGLHYVIVFEYNYRRICEQLTNFVDNINAQSWHEIGEKIGTIGKWEFQDYKQ
jgi:hypothetical protein